METMVYSYLPNAAIYDVKVGDDYIAGEYGPYRQEKGAGGGVVCCANVKPGPVTVSWKLDVRKTDPRYNRIYQAAATVPSIPSDAKYLAVHIYPDAKVVFEPSSVFVLDRNEDGSRGD